MKYAKLFKTTSEITASGATVSTPSTSVLKDKNAVWVPKNIGTEANIKYDSTDDEIYLDYNARYLTFEAIESGTFSFTKRGTGDDIQYSIDEGATWVSLASGANTPTINAGGKIWWKATITPAADSGVRGIGTFSSTGKFNAFGNAMSLLFGDNFEGQLSLSGKTNALYGLFQNNTNILSAEKLCLPATIMINYGYAYMFYGCTSLVKPPQLPATTLNGDCYLAMFYGCTSLTYAPDLPAPMGHSWAYSSMFYGCTSLTEAPKISATRLYGGSCFRNMFTNCTSLTAVPELNISAMTVNCYDSMFAGCTSLKIAPELPATVLTGQCYCGMFSGCTSLTVAPALSATTLAEGCYQSMFAGCTSLTDAPVLPAMTLAANCYKNMFNGCKRLRHIKALFTTAASSAYTENWVSGVCYSGTFEKSSGATWNLYGNNGVPANWEMPTMAENYLTFLAVEAGTFKFTNHGTGDNVQYSIDGGATWVSIASNTNTPTVAAGKKIMWRGTRTPYSLEGIGTFSSSGRFNVYGNVNSMAFGSGFINQNSLSGKGFCFCTLFSGCAKLESAGSMVLPSTTLEEACYIHMFSNCTTLAVGPKILPSMDLKDTCYAYMFEGCVKLTVAPVLPATTLPNNADGCYESMFYNCAKLTYIKALFIGIPPQYSTTDWVHGVAPTGTFVKHEDAEWDIWGDNGVPYDWYVKGGS